MEQPALRNTGEPVRIRLLPQCKDRTVNDKYYTGGETAERLGVSAPTVTNLTRRGLLTAVTIPSGTKRTRCFYLKTDIETYAVRQR